VISVYNPTNWYWLVNGSTTEVYSSASNTYVPTTDATFESWLQQGNRPSNIVSEAELWGVVSQAVPNAFPSWLFNGTTFAQPSAGNYTPAQLAAYAQDKQGQIMVGGISVNVGTSAAPQNVEASTSTASLVLLQGAAAMAQASSSATFQWVESTGVTVTLTAAQVLAILSAVTTFMQSTFSVLSAVLAAITAGTITTKAEVDTPPSPIAAWPVNS
jgi:hypothetical protein